MGTTSLLLQAIECATASKNCKELGDIIDTILDQHLESSRQLQAHAGSGSCHGVFKELDAGIVEDCEELRSFLSAAQVSLSHHDIKRR